MRGGRLLSSLYVKFQISFQMKNHQIIHAPIVISIDRDSQEVSIWNFKDARERIADYWIKEKIAELLDAGETLWTPFAEWFKPKALIEIGSDIKIILMSEWSGWIIHNGKKIGSLDDRFIEQSVYWNDHLSNRIHQIANQFNLHFKYSSL